MDADTAPRMLEKVRAELARYEHPLFVFEARGSGEAVEITIRLKRSEPEVDPYKFPLEPREIESAQFAWSFQRQLYDCLHDYVIEMFTSNPQRRD
jgi:hypothetical protein